MPRQKSTLLKALAFLSVLTSFAFVYYSLGILTAESVDQWRKVFAYVAIGYGLGNLYILSWAWRSGGSWAGWANKLIALCFFGVFVLDRWQTGIGSPLEYVGIIGVAAILWLNWLAATKLSAE